MLGQGENFGVKEAKEIIRFSEEEKHQIIKDYLQSGLTKQAIWEKYTGRREEHGHLLSWMRKYGLLNLRKQVLLLLGGSIR